MRSQSVRTVAVVGMVVFLSLVEARAWSTAASKTDSDIRTLAVALEGYKGDVGMWGCGDVGMLPAADRYWLELLRANKWEARDRSRPVDHWGRPLVYRVPGKYGEFDLYSYGANGMDDDGKLDDISSWAGVNDGYYWKATWPRGRWTIAVGVALGLGCLLFGRVFSWRLVVPVAGLVACLGVLLGCHWLEHPGIVPERNGWLGLWSLGAAGVLVVCLVVVILELRGRGIVLSRRSEVGDRK